MNDGKQGISFDRWLIRIRDILLIVVTVFGMFWQTHKYLSSLEQKDKTITYLQTQVSELRAQNNLRARVGH